MFQAALRSAHSAANRLQIGWLPGPSWKESGASAVGDTGFEPVTSSV